MSPTIILVIGILVGLFALGMLTGAVVSFIRQRRKFAGRASATGSVVELRNRITTSGRSAMVCPVVEFQAPSGAAVRFESEFGSMPARHRVGQVVNVLYDPANPEQAEIDSRFSRLLLPGVLTFMGVITACAAVAFIVFYGLIYLAGQ